MDSSYSARMVSVAILPFFAIYFSNESVALGGNYELSGFLNRLRGSLLDRACYGALVGHIKIPFADEDMVFSPLGGLAAGYCSPQSYGTVIAT